jgi:hypothetical protein
MIGVVDWGRDDRLDEYRWAFVFIIIYGAKGLLNFFLDMAANVVSAVIVSSPILAKGTSGWGCFRASVIS